MDAHRTTLLLRRLDAGDEDAAGELLPLVYGELHDLARAYMARERMEHTLQPTALIHEAWMRLVGDETPEFVGRAHFIGVAARAMRRILIDHARRRKAEKRGAGADKLPFDEALDAFQDGAPDLVELDVALGRLEKMDAELARIVELRFFAGATNEETADALGVSTRTVERGWKTAQAFLRAEIDGAA